MSEPTTHDLARALLRLPDVDIHATSMSQEVAILRTWAVSQVVESRIRGVKPEDTRFGDELERILNHYTVSRETQNAIVEDFRDKLFEILGVQPRPQTELTSRREPTPPLPDTEALVLLDEVCGLATEIINLRSSTEGLRKALGSRVQEIYQRGDSRPAVKNLMKGLTAPLRSLSKAAEQDPAHTADLPRSQTPPPEVPRSVLDRSGGHEAFVPLPRGGGMIPLELQRQLTSVTVPSRPYAPNPLGVSTSPPRTFQNACRAQLDYATTGDPTDLVERRDRFLEEALELSQAVGMSRDDAAALVEYVFGREVGEPGQEVGGTLCTLAHLASYAGLDSEREGRRELDRTWQPDIIAKIRAKRATRHGRGPLPGTT